MTKSTEGPSSILSEVRIIQEIPAETLKFLNKNPTLIWHMNEVLFFEHPDHGDEAQLIAVFPNGYMLEDSSLWELPLDHGEFDDWIDWLRRDCLFDVKLLEEAPLEIHEIRDYILHRTKQIAENETNAERND